MELAPTAWHVFSAALIFLIGALLSIKIARLFETSGKRAFVLYIWHTLFCFVYVAYVINSGGDALMYYQTSLSGDVEFSFGTAAIQFLTMIFSNVFGLSVLGASLGYNILGYVGLLAVDASLQTATKHKEKLVRYLATFIIFLPSVSFWSSAIGKDALSFLAAGLALWASQKLGRRGWVMAVAITLMLFVRPHISAMMVMAVAVSMMVQPRVSIFQRAFVGIPALAVAILMVPFAMNYTGLGSDARVVDFVDYVDVRQSHNIEGGGGIDISSMSLPVKLFTYLFRPLPFEANSLPAFAASIDNVILLLLVVFSTWPMVKRWRSSAPANRIFLWVYSLSTWLVLALTTANLGISVRQKWMFAPMLIFLFISVLGKSRLFPGITKSNAEMIDDPRKIIR